MDSRAHPFQCLMLGCCQERQVAYLASNAELFQVDSETGETHAQWRSEQQSFISILAVSSDETHLAAVTSDDKAVHVLSCAGLVHKSRRVLPKRPSALSFSTDGTMLYVADKDGDVYVLAVEASASFDLVVTQQMPKKQKLNATEFTVHSQRNLKALEHQLKVATNGPEQGQTPGRNGTDAVYTGDAQIGHVSMLTDILVTRISGSTAGKRRDIVITADRDEHIRISRGFPQTQVIEGFCLGHISYVNRLCLLRDDVLVSGGGDDSLFIWKLPSYELLQTLPLRDLAEHGRQSTQEPGQELTIAVTQLHGNIEEDGSMRLYCACESIAALIVFTLQDEDQGQAYGVSACVVPLEGNPLAIAHHSDKVAVSLDSVTEPGCARKQRQIAGPRIQALEWRNGQERFLAAVEKIGAQVHSSNFSALTASLSGAEYLRKRRHNEDN